MRPILSWVSYAMVPSARSTVSDWKSPLTPRGLELEYQVPTIGSPLLTGTQAGGLGGPSGLASVMAAGFLAAQPARIRATPNAPAIRKYRLLMNSSTRPPTRRADPRRAPRATNIRHSKEGKMKNQRRLLRPRAPSAIAQQSSWRGASFSAGTRKNALVSSDTASGRARCRRAACAALPRRGALYIERKSAATSTPHNGRRCSCLISRSATMVRVWRMPGMLNRKRCRKRS